VWEIEKENIFGYSAIILLIKVDLPTPDGPAMIKTCLKLCFPLHFDKNSTSKDCFGEVFTLPYCAW